MVPAKGQLRRKALLAIAFAGGVFTTQMPALSETKSEATTLLIQEIVESKQTPEVRSYHLLTLARPYLDGRSRAEVESQFNHAWNAPGNTWNFKNGRSVLARQTSVSIWLQQPQTKSFTQEEFKECEMLQLRALAVDRWGPKNSLRRKTHGDLSFWYMKLRRGDLADKKRQTFFKLVESNDDSLLYPTPAGCGQLDWLVIAQGAHWLLACGLG